MKYFFRSVIAFVGVVSVVSAAPTDVTITQGWVRVPRGENTAAYMTVKTNHNEKDRLIKASCEFAEVVELHNHINDKGVMKMRPVSAVDVGPTPVYLKPGGMHIMLMKVKPDLKDQKEITLKLTFEKAGEVIVTVPVKAAA